MKPKFIFRYGATFRDAENLIYELTAVDAFNKNLVKGIRVHISEFQEGKNTILKFINSNGREAKFELIEGETKKLYSISKGESLEKIHNAMSELYLESLNKTKIILSNGIELTKGNIINPYSYAQTLQESMISEAISNHFKLEKELLKRSVKIKPLTLFFIDNIAEYRNNDGYIRKIVEKYIKAEVINLLKTEIDTFYKGYLEKTLIDISKSHAGYFSKDNSEKDEAIEQELNEILHDKTKMLSIDNPRRFIFSKWTLREGWDNPNVFQICKIRSSGSDESKLQEVGRGLRLPVNEFGNREKNEQFYLNYFVDFTESNFVNQLVQEINDKSGAISIEDSPTELNEFIIKQINEKYNVNKRELLEKLDSLKIIDRENKFILNGFEYIKLNFPFIFEGVNSNKIRKDTDQKKQVTIRIEKYTELKDLWEKINHKVILEYKIKNEADFKDLLVTFLKQDSLDLIEENLNTKTKNIIIQDNKAASTEEVSIQESKIFRIKTMEYNIFLKELSSKTNINIKTLNQSFIDSRININKHLNNTSINLIKQKFNNYLMYECFSKFEIDYQKISTSIHPTKFTDQDGNIKKEIESSNVGIMFGEEKVSDNYFFDELFYDSELEKQNIQEKITEVTVFTKIPKNSIKIPIAGGRSYSPDFAYVLNFKDGKKKLYFIVETKNIEEESLRIEESQKIKHAEKFFGNNIEIKFKTQFKNKDITELIRDIYKDITT